MRSITKREKYLIIFLAIAFVLFTYSRFFLLPVLDDIKASQQKIENDKTQVSELQIMKTSNITLRKNLTQVKVKYTDALKQLPVFEKDPEIAYNVKAMADKSDVKLNSITLADSTLFVSKAADQAATADAAPNGENIYSVPVSINAEGSSYADIMNFIASIEMDSRIAEINTLNIVKQQDISLTMNFTYLFSLDNAGEVLTYEFNKGTYGKPDPFN